MEAGVEVEVKEVENPVETQASQVSAKKTRTQNYNEQEDTLLCVMLGSTYVSLDATVGTDQSKDKF
jgi:hypothetical protein